MAETLPEGTDQIKPGASGTGTTASGGTSHDTGERLRGEASDLKAKAQAKAGEFREMAAEQARDYADQGKEKASGALDSVAKLIDENARQIDDRLGSQYGDYARRASAFVSDAATGLRSKDIEDLLDDARAFVRRSPGIAIAAATAAGFLAARVVKAGTPPEDPAAQPRRAPASGARRSTAGRGANS